jgi:hypothetical protein
VETLLAVKVMPVEQIPLMVAAVAALGALVLPVLLVLA